MSTALDPTSVTRQIEKPTLVASETQTLKDMLTDFA